MKVTRLRAALDAHQIALVQMVTPVTKPERMRAVVRRQPGLRLCGHHDGHDGQERRCPCRGHTDYLDRVRELARVPVCAGFGIRSREQVELLRGHVDGVVIGSALVEVLERGEDATQWLRKLRPQR